MQPYDHRNITANGVNLHVVHAGPEQGEPLILLHGFPEFWYGWRKQIEYFSARGFRLIVPDQRGYNQSDKPQGIAAYNLDLLAADIVGLMDAGGYDRVNLVGHDWGAFVAWWIGIKYPQRLKKLVILNVPHPAVFSRYIRSHPAQMRKSWYIFAMQLPWLPEKLLSANQYASLASAITSSANPGAFTEADLSEYRRAWSQPGAVTGMINWYRAIYRSKAQPPASVRVTVPTHIIWGKRDHVLSWQMAEESLKFCDDGRLEFIDTATHWVQHEEPERVNSLIEGFLGA